MDAPYGKLEQLESGIARLLAHNPSPFTFTGTQTYFIGKFELAIVDPGPDAYGFELDVCIPRGSGELVCAADEVFR